MKKIESDPSYIAILHYIHKRGKAYPDELAYRMGVSRQAIDYRLRRLIEHHYIKKLRDERVYYVLTDKGRRLVESRNRVLGKRGEGATKPIALEFKEHTENDLKTRIKSKLFLIPVAIGLISLGQHIASGDVFRGMLSLGIWMAISLVVYLITSK